MKQICANFKDKDVLTSCYLSVVLKFSASCNLKSIKPTLQSDLSGQADLNETVSFDILNAAFTA